MQVTGGSPKACMIESGDERFWLEHEWDTGSWVHPPLGKLTIGLGVEAFSMSSFGWRFTSALAGIGVAVFTALMAQLLFARPVWTFVAGLLIAVEGLNVVQSRVALLDIHLAFWVTLGFLLLLMDRRFIDRRTDAVFAASAKPTSSRHRRRARRGARHDRGSTSSAAAALARSSARGAWRPARPSAPPSP